MKVIFHHHLGISIGLCAILLSGCGSVGPEPSPSDPVCTQDGLRPGYSTPCCSSMSTQEGICCSDSACAPPAPDLALEQFLLHYTVPASGTGDLYLCINQDASGNPQAYGDKVQIANVGKLDSQPYKVGVGIISTSSNRIFLCPSQLQAPQGTPAGHLSTWSNPWCCHFNLTSVPAGEYRLYLIADVEQQVNDASRQNNAVTSNSTLMIP